MDKSNEKVDTKDYIIGFGAVGLLTAIGAIPLALLTGHTLVDGILVIAVIEALVIAGWFVPR